MLLQCSSWIFLYVILAVPKKARPIKDVASHAYSKLILLSSCYYEDELNALHFLTIYSILLESTFNFDFVNVIVY